MLFLGLDLSTKTGYAVLRDDKLVIYGKVTVGELDEVYSDSLPEYCMIKKANSIAGKIKKLLYEYRPDIVCVEQTNLGRSRITQKQLEFIHFAVLDMLMIWQFDTKINNTKVIYADTSAWRSCLKIKLSKEQRKHNKAVKDRVTRGKITAKHLAVAYVNQKYNLKLKLKDNDEADAIALAEYAKIKHINQKNIPNADLNKIFS